MLEREYIAFISYRHKPLDIHIAKRLHRLIEHYHVPKDLRKGDSRRLGYVFRDRDELSLSGDLRADIKSALDRSDFLIVICTPDTPESDWISLEIEYFLKNHDRSRLLAVLAAGSPEKSFPMQLTHIYEADGITLNRSVEPLAANVASPLRIKRDYLVKEEFLRLAAAILECPYDMLKQREKRYIQQRRGVAAAMVTVTAMCFAGVVMWKNGEIQRQNKEIQAQLEQSLKNESQALALVSAQLLEQGDRLGAVENALKALPSAEQDRPELVEAEFALCNALYAYQDERMRAACEVEQETEIERITVSQGGDYVVTRDRYGFLRCFDGYTGELRWKRDMGLSDDFTIIESKQAVLVFVRDSMVLWSLEDGTVLDDIRLDILKYQCCAYVSDTQEVIAVRTNYQVNFYQMSDFGEISTVTIPEKWMIESYGCCWSADGTKYAVVVEGWDDDYLLYVVDVNEGSLLYQMSFEPNPEDTHSEIGIVFLPDNDLMILRSYSNHLQDLYRVDDETVSIEYRRLFTEEYETDFSQTLLFNESMLVCSRGKDVLIFDLETGNLLEHQILPSYCKACYFLEEDCQRYVAVLSSGEVRTENLPNYDDWQPHEEPIVFQTGFDVSEAHGSSMGTDYVCVLPEDEKYHALLYRSLGDEQKKELSVADFGDVIYLFPSGDKVLYLACNSLNGRICDSFIIYDALSMEEDACYEFSNDDSWQCFSGFLEGGTKLLFSGGIFDLETEAWISISDLERHMPEFQEPYIQEAGTFTTSVRFTVGGRLGYGKLYWWEDGKNVKESACPYWGGSFYDSYSFATGGSGLIGIAFEYDELHSCGMNIYTRGYAVYSREKDAWLYLPNPCEDSICSKFCVGNQNPWLAFCDDDGFLRIVNGETGEVVRTFLLEIPADAVNEMHFLLDDKVLLMRQNENRICILDTDDGTVKFLQDFGGNWDGGIYWESRLSIQLDEAGGNLYIGECHGDIEGLCIDLSTWKVRSRIPGLVGFSSQSRQIIKRENKIQGRDNYVSYPAYSLEKLIEKGNNLLGR